VHAALDLGWRLLDVGCGDGRVAGAFARLGARFEGRYSAFDIDAARIDALQELFRDDPRFRFDHVDLFHPYYNKKGTIDPATHVYAYPDQSFDVVFYNSVFTHMTLKIIEQNLRQAARCLVRRGKIWASFYLLDEHEDPGYAGRHYPFKQAYDEGFTNNLDKPEGAIAYRKERILQVLAQIGLEVIKELPGYWKRAQHSLDQHEQDVLVMRKVDREESWR
jgi:SAM-dependent methyltransferase